MAPSFSGDHGQVLAPFTGGAGFCPSRGLAQDEPMGQVIGRRGGGTQVLAAVGWGLGFPKAGESLTCPPLPPAWAAS